LLADRARTILLLGLLDWTILSYHKASRCRYCRRWDALTSIISATSVRSELFRPQSRLRRSLAVKHLSSRGTSWSEGSGAGIVTFCKDLFRPRRRPSSSLGLARALVGQLGDGGLADGAGEWADAATVLPRVGALLFCGWERYGLLAVCSTVGIGQWVWPCMLLVWKSPGYLEAGSALEGIGLEGILNGRVYSGHIVVFVMKSP
jgi:hypothetical protein